MKKELAGLQPAHYSYHGRHVPLNVALDSPWNFSNMPDEICIPCSTTKNAAVNRINCCSMVDVIDNVVNESMDETIDSIFGMQETETVIFGELQPDDSSVEDLLSIDDSIIVKCSKIPMKMTSKITMKMTIKTVMEYTYGALNEFRNKIISFPELKNHIEENFLCKNVFFIRNNLLFLLVHCQYNNRLMVLPLV